MTDQQVPDLVKPATGGLPACFASRLYLLCTVTLLLLSSGLILTEFSDQGLFYSDPCGRD